MVSAQARSLERFAHFFRRGFFAQRAFETLNSENKPEHVGFRKATQRLYKARVHPAGHHRSRTVPLVALSDVTQ